MNILPTWKELRSDWMLYLFLFIVTIITFAPLLLMVNISTKNSAQFAVNPLGVTFPFHLKTNYAFAFKLIWRPALNTIFVSITSVAIGIFLSSMAAYILAVFDFPGRELIFWGLTVLLMVPAILTLVPRYLIIVDLKLINTYWALILPYIAQRQVFNIFVFRTFFRNLPKEVLEAARIEGASNFRIYWSIVMPMSKPIIATLALLGLLVLWNDFVWPLVTLDNPELRTLTLALYQLASAGSAQWGIMMAGYVLASLPLLILFIIFTKPFVEGMTSGAIKL
ncbi:MAG: carbohydrate ABC transporter permease [Chloroflexi bacterium]|nr:carbohydrate ABC transporter permease [Chloroflexota bacterium]